MSLNDRDASSTPGSGPGATDLPEAGSPAGQRWPAAIALALFVLAGSSLLLYLVDDNLGGSWPSNVMRNWHDFGLRALKGKLVENPGGFEALTNPTIYPGHKPLSLYPAYAVERLFAWTGGGRMPFFILLAAFVFWSIWLLLGRDFLAYLIGGVTVLCPGYLRWLVVLDPNTLSAFVGILFASVMLLLLARKRLSAGAIVGLVLLSFAYTWLQWTTALVHGMVLAYLIASRRFPWKRIALYVCAAAAGSLLVGAASILDKLGAGGSGPHSNFWEFLGGYTWGAGGYNAGQTVTRSFIRVAVVTGVSLLPLLLVLTWAAWARWGFRRDPRWLALLPAIAGAIELGVFRNYAGAHPWMSAQLLLVGILLTARALRTPPVEDTATVRERPVGTGSLRNAAGLMAACFTYGLLVILAFRSNVEDGLALLRMVRVEVPRGEPVLVVRSVDPGTANDSVRLAEFLDRRVVALDDLASTNPPARSAFVLSNVKIDSNLPLVATSSDAKYASRLPLSGAARRVIRLVMRRTAQERMEIGGTYFLYRWPGSRQSP